MRRHALRFFIVLLLAGCTGSPPRPPAPQGDYRPINKTHVMEYRHQATRPVPNLGEP